MIEDYIEPFKVGRNYNRERLIELSQLYAKSIKKGKKQKISMNVNREILKKWDELSESIGLNRTAMVHIAVGFFDLIVKNSSTNSNLKKKIEGFERELKRLSDG